MRDLVIYKLGHDASNPMHRYMDETFTSVINSSDPSNPFYNPKNVYASEFSMIKGIVKSVINAEYVGVCHYRTLIGEIDPSLPYVDCLRQSERIIRGVLDNGYNGIISTPFHKGVTNVIARPRWTGSKSLEYILKYCTNIGLRKEFLNYLYKSDDSSYRVVSVLPNKEFKRIFGIVTDAYDFFYEARLVDGTLIPRSVGYDQETLTSFLLIQSSMENNYARLPHTIL